MRHRWGLVKDGIRPLLASPPPIFHETMSATLPDPEEIKGVIHAVVFHNEENGYTIMQVDRAAGDRITVLGNLPAVVEGEEIHALGHWRKDQKFGRQFQADRIHAVAPASSQGIERFLASGLIDGIGKTYAKRIVEAFGTDTFRIIDEESQKLESVPGIGKARRIKIKESWKRQKSVRDIMIFLHEQGISTARALRLYKEYGENAVDILRADPYRLAKEIPGIGFKTADEIARKMGQPDDSPKRLQSGILFVLEQAEHQGHCALPRPILVEQAAETLSIPAEQADLAIDHLAGEDKIVIRGTGSEPLVFLQELDEAEAVIAASLRELVAAPATLPTIQPEAAIEWFERHHQLKLGDEQAAAVLQACRSRFSIITGGPGVGKTTILQAVLAILTSKKVRPILCAPTGRAARQLSESTGFEAATIHRTLEYQPGHGFTRDRSHPLEGDLLVIDEASMLDVRLMAQLLLAMPRKASLLLVGDVDQLPSVGPGNLLHDMIRSGIAPVSRLSQIYRQVAASSIIAASHAVNRGELPPLQNEADSDFFFLDRESPEEILATVEHLLSKRIPEGFGMHPRDDIQLLTPMNRQSLGTRELNQKLQGDLNPPSEFKTEIERFGTTFREGDKVMQTRNNYEKEIYNGDIGHIIEITTEPTSIYVRFGEEAVHFEPGELDEVQLAYAITIHKSQGSEFPAVVIPLSSQHYVLLQRNLLYTAITRGKRLVILVGERKALEMAVQRAKSAHRHTGLQERLGVSET
jgi:exodeoxyribonuclease V alpha subunit